MPIAFPAGMSREQLAPSPTPSLSPAASRYGEEWGWLGSTAPRSVFLAEGSAVRMFERHSRKP